ncbi:hypothetical protein ONZ45_g3698 [Pleurotus djamor]|nr:hypothetical protein ONZ45_g3698 [Pleurotus djamor]
MCVLATLLASRCKFHLLPSISSLLRGNRYILYIAPSMLFDTTVFLMLSTAIFKRARENPLTKILHIILRDGILYFTVVLLLNAAWMAAALTLPRNSQNILALMTVTLVGRLTLNLRKGSDSVIFDTSTNGNGRLKRFVHIGDASTGMYGEDIELSSSSGRAHKPTW